MTSVLVTGSSGFIGNNVCRTLVNEGYDVSGIDVVSPTFDLPQSVDEREADLTDSPTLPNVDVIVHLAAHSQVQPVVEDPSLAIENIEMTKHVLDEAVRMNAAVINASSRDVYGSNILPSEDEVTPDSPNGYAASKLGSESIINAYRHTHDISALSLRLANVYGPRDLNMRVIPIFLALADAGEELTIYGEEKILDFVYIDDVCGAILSVIENRAAVSGETMNIGSGNGTTLTTLAEQIVDQFDSCPGWTRETNRSGDVQKYISNLSKTQSILNFETRTLASGLSETIDWYRDHRKVLERIRPN